VTKEIPSSQWAAFLDEFSRTHRAWRATVDLVEPGKGLHVDAVERPLRSVSPNIQADRIVSVDIRFQENGEPRSSVQVQTPVAIRIEETSEGTTRGVEIIDTEGRCTRIRFRTAPRSEMLDGIAPGELSNP
jgi:Family of unknown function (DUF5335)